MALGGPHVTLMPDEAQAHADVIFVGEAEAHWPQFLKDFESGKHMGDMAPPLLPHLMPFRWHARNYITDATSPQDGSSPRGDVRMIAIFVQ